MKQYLMKFRYFLQKKSKHFFTILLISISLFGYSQTIIKKDSDLRFSGKVSGLPGEKDKVGLMKDFNLTIQWWAFSGEPMEYYEFNWTANNYFKIDDTKIERQKLSKYPDLLKRFDMLKPSNMELHVVGSLDVYSMDICNRFAYIIPDYKVLYFKAATPAKNLSPDSPETWLQFLKWCNSSNKVNFQYGYTGAIQESSEEHYNSLSGPEKGDLIKAYRNKFVNAKQIGIIDLKAEIEWPLQEMRSIAKLFVEYEKGEKEPSPLEQVAEAQKEINKETTYTKDDFWGEIADLEQSKVEIFKNSERYGLRTLTTKRDIIEAKFSFLQKVVCYDCGNNPLPKTYFFGGISHYKYGETNKLILFDDSGRKIADNFENVKIYTKKYPIQNKFEWTDRYPKNKGELVIYRFIRRYDDSEYNYTEYELDIYNMEFIHLATVTEISKVAKIESSGPTLRIKKTN